MAVVHITQVAVLRGKICIGSNMRSFGTVDSGHCKEVVVLCKWSLRQILLYMATLVGSIKGFYLNIGWSIILF